MLKPVKKSRAFRNLSVTIVFTFLSLVAVALLISTGLAVYSNFQSQRKAIAIQQQLIAQNAANTVKSFVNEKVGILEKSIALGRLATAS